MVHTVLLLHNLQILPPLIQVLLEHILALMLFRIFALEWVTAHAFHEDFRALFDMVFGVNYIWDEFATKNTRQAFWKATRAVLVDKLLVFNWFSFENAVFLGADHGGGIQNVLHKSVVFDEISLFANFAFVFFAFDARLAVEKVAASGADAWLEHQHFANVAVKLMSLFSTSGAHIFFRLLLQVLQSSLVHYFFYALFAYFDFFSDMFFELSALLKNFLIFRIHIFLHSYFNIAKVQAADHILYLGGGVLDWLVQARLLLWLCLLLKRGWRLHIDIHLIDNIGIHRYWLLLDLGIGTASHRGSHLLIGLRAVLYRWNSSISAVIIIWISRNTIPHILHIYLFY